MGNEQVYYDPRARVLFTVKRQLKKYVVVGGLWSPYFNDARTSYIRHRISNAYFQGCQPIDETSKLLINDGVGFRLIDGDPLDGENPFHRVDGNPNFKYLKEYDRIVKAHENDYPLPSDCEFDEVYSD